MRGNLQVAELVGLAINQSFLLEAPGQFDQGDSASVRFIGRGTSLSKWRRWLCESVSRAACVMAITAGCLSFRSREIA